MSKSRKSVNSFANLLDLQGVQEIVCYNQQSEARKKFVATAVTEKDNKQEQMDAMFETRRLQTQPKLSRKGLNQYRRFLGLRTR